MKKIEVRYRVVFVMDDGAELEWKMFNKVEHYHAFVHSVSQAEMRKFGIVAIRYKRIFVE